MMMRKFTRDKEDIREYRKTFVLAYEGKKTEPIYFSKFKKNNLKITECRGNSKSSPRHVLARMKRQLIDRNFRKFKLEEAWIIIDRDEWNEKDIELVYEWSKKCNRHNLVLSNPKFELWLLLHFEDVGCITSDECSERLRNHLPNYHNKKKFDPEAITDSMVNSAIKRAKKLDIPPCNGWPHQTGTTVYKLVSSLMEFSTTAT